MLYYYSQTQFSQFLRLLAAPLCRAGLNKLQTKLHAAKNRNECEDGNGGVKKFILVADCGLIKN